MRVHLIDHYCYCLCCENIIFSKCYHIIIFSSYYYYYIFFADETLCSQYHPRIQDTLSRLSQSLQLAITGKKKKKEEEEEEAIPL
jgi:hypothetical protein